MTRLGWRARVQWLPVVVFLVAAVAMMPRALLGMRAYTPIDVTARSSPMRDQATAPTIVNPVQNDVPEAQAVLAGFWRDLRGGHLQFWSHNTGAGVPTGALPFNALTAPMSVPYLLAPRWYAPALRALVWLLAAQWGLYLLARRVGIGIGAATVAGVAFAFSGAEQIMLFRIGAAAVGPWVLWAVCGVIVRPSARRAAVLAATVAWSWLEGFPAATLFTVYVALAWAAWLAVTEWRARGESGEARLRSWLGRRALAGAGGFALAGLLVGFQLLPFASAIRDSGLLDTRKFDGTFAMGSYTLFGQLDNAVIGGLSGPWLSVANSFEGIGFTGSIALAGAAVALMLGALGRLRAERRVRDNVGAFGIALAVLVVLCYTGGRLLDLAYALPGMRSNTIYRHRWLIPLFAALLLGAALDHAWRRRRLLDDTGANGATADTVQTRLSRVTAGLGFLACAVVVVRAVPTLREGLHTFHTGRAFAIACARGTVYVAAVVAAVAASRRRVGRSEQRSAATAGRAAIASPVMVAALVWVQLAVPMRGWVPEAPVAPYFSTSELAADLQRLAGTTWRFTGTNEYTPYLNSAIVDGLLDLRTTPVLDQQYRSLLSSGVPNAFGADKLKTIIDPATLDLRSAVLDEFSVRYVVLGTDEGPLGDADPQPPVDRWVAVAQASTLGPIVAGGGVAGVGVALRTSATDASRCTGFVRVGLRPVSATDLGGPPAGGAADVEIGSARRPARDLIGLPADRDLTVAIVGGEQVPLDTRLAVTVSIEDGACPVEVGVTAAANDASGMTAPPVAARLFYLPADRAWKVVATRQGWVYERRSAKPLVRIEGGTVRSFALVTNGVTAEVSTPVGGTLVVAENDDRGWHATVDGRAAPIVAVDGALLGVAVPAGDHVVRFDYVPPGWWTGVVLTVLGLAGLAGCLLAGRHRREGSVVGS